MRVRFLCSLTYAGATPRQHEYQRHQQRRCTAVVQHGDGQRPLQQDIRQAAGELQGDETEQERGVAGQGRAAARAQREPA